MSIFPIPYRIQSINTRNFAISKPSDKPGQEVNTGDYIPDDSILFTNIPIGPQPIVVEITGVAPKRLYVSLSGDSKVTWSEEKYLWLVRRTSQDTFVITPANGSDLFWVNESKVDHVQVLPGSDVRPPQNEWAFIPA